MKVNNISAIRTFNSCNRNKLAETLNTREIIKKNISAIELICRRTRGAALDGDEVQHKYRRQRTHTNCIVKILHLNEGVQVVEVAIGGQQTVAF